MAHSDSLCAHTNGQQKSENKGRETLREQRSHPVESLGGCDMHDPNHFPMHRVSFIARRLPQLEARTDEHTESAAAAARWTRSEREDDLYGRASCIIDLAEPIVIESCRAVGIFIFLLFISLCMHTQVSSFAAGRRGIAARSLPQRHTPLKAIYSDRLTEQTLAAPRASCCWSTSEKFTCSPA